VTEPRVVKTRLLRSLPASLLCTASLAMVSEIASIYGKVDYWISSVVRRKALMSASTIRASTSLLTLTVVNDFRTRLQT
jgi:hypothetical protein